MNTSTPATVRALDDPVVLARAAHIIRTARARAAAPRTTAADPAATGETR